MTRPIFPSLVFAALSLGIAFCTYRVSAQPNSSRNAAERLLEVDDLTPDEARVFMHRFRNTRLASDFVFDFHLKHYPARGRPTIYAGMLAGTWDDQGPVQRIELARSSEHSVSNTSWLIHAGGNAAIYEPATNSEDTEGWVKVDESRVATESLIQGTPITAFDLQFPFVYWKSFEWIKSERILGRPAHVFDMTPPGTVQSTSGNIARVRLYIDVDFTALLRAEYFDPSDKLVRQLKVLSFKKVSGQTIPKVLDFVDSGSREKVRFEIRAAALNQKVPNTVFDLLGTPEGSFTVSQMTFERL
ncbi:MAG: outer membrane lipoprotein-sorting protein [Verrucomicrobiota bacterium]